MSGEFKDIVVPLQSFPIEDHKVQAGDSVENLIRGQIRFNKKTLVDATLDRYAGTGATVLGAVLVGPLGIELYDLLVKQEPHLTGGNIGLGIAGAGIGGFGLAIRERAKLKIAQSLAEISGLTSALAMHLLEVEKAKKG